MSSHSAACPTIQSEVVRIAFIAMSGVRAWSPELNRLGLTMPGIMERGQVIASLPSLSLLTLAGMTPRDCDISYHEIRDLNTQGADHLPKADLVAISTMTAQVGDAYKVADLYRSRGTRVVMGGLHVTSLPEEALQHCDAVIVGEGENHWHQLLADASRGTLLRIYRSNPADSGFDLAQSPIPRFDLLNIDQYNRIPIQTTRGCPHSCEFCASSILLTPRYKLKPADRFEAELLAVKSRWPEPFIELADDNSFCSPAHARSILDVLSRHSVSWFTEADVSIAEDPDLLARLAKSGCRQLLIGLESPTSSGLDGLETRRNWKLKQYPRYEAAVRRIQSHGITVNGCFILGLDGHTPEIFDRVHDFAMSVGLYDVQITVLTPFPGTPLYTRLLAEGRILEPGAWHKCTLFDVNHNPSHMTPEQLQNGLVELAGKLYSDEAIRQRRQIFYQQRAAGPLAFGG